MAKEIKGNKSMRDAVFYIIGFLIGSLVTYYTTYNNYNNDYKYYTNNIVLSPIDSVITSKDTIYIYEVEFSKFSDKKIINKKE